MPNKTYNIYIYNTFTGFKEIINASRHIWKGGETEGLLRLQCHLQRKAFIASYGKPKMTPQSLLASPTGLAPYLRFGCLSTRLFFAKLNDLYQEVNATISYYFIQVNEGIIYSNLLNVDSQSSTTAFVARPTVVARFLLLCVH